jgi:hypothetical protein
LQLHRGDANQLIDALRVKIAAEPLRVRRQERCVSVVDLLRRKAPAALGPTDHDMRILDLIQRDSSFAIPSYQ